MTSTQSPVPLIVTVRRVIVWVVIVSFTIAAIGGIAVLLGADLGPESGRVLGTTAIVGLFSIAILCCATLLGRRWRVFGLVGVGISAVTLVLTVLLIWGWSWFTAELWPVQVLWTGIAATVALSLASLLLLLADRRRPAVRLGLWVTLVLFVLVFLLVVFTIWARDYDSEFVFRTLGVLAILATLGAIIVPVLSLLLPDEGPPTPPPTLEQRLYAEAERRGITVEQLVAPLFEQPQGP